MFTFTFKPLTLYFLVGLERVHVQKPFTNFETAVRTACARDLADPLQTRHQNEGRLVGASSFEDIEESASSRFTFSLVPLPACSQDDRSIRFLCPSGPRFPVDCKRRPCSFEHRKSRATICSFYLSRVAGPLYGFHAISINVSTHSPFNFSHRTRAP